jgi:hypothetical protein
MTGRDDDRAVRYLLDELPEADREAFEDEYFGEEGVYGALLAAEDDLIDRYCEDGLTPDQRARFEQRYLTTEEGRERLEFARALKRLGQRPSGQPPGTVPAVSARAALRWLPWAAVLVTALGALVFIRLQGAEARRARDERAALQERLAQQQQRSRQQERRLGELGQQIGRVQEQARAMEELLGAAAAKGLGVASLALKGGLRRDASALSRVALRPDVAILRLQLQLDGPPRTAYRASLQAPEGRELWARDGLPAARADGGSVVAFTVPAAVLAPGQYVVILGPAGARGESDAEFVFEVRRSR